MFDIGFWELVVVGVVALIVLGPEKLPVVARKAGLWIGRIRRFVNEAKQDIDRELRLKDVRDAIERNAGLDEIKRIIDTGRYHIEDEIAKTESALKAQVDLKTLDSPPPSPGEENQHYAHKEHLVDPLDANQPPVQHENTAGVTLNPVMSPPAAASVVTTTIDPHGKQPSEH
ncbi:MAG: twin-arginine translocase subunit TatB [Gammaproteobacteria bacterium]|nr:twin-arginine translocase subunit TatB [Gammaproteobacteria bacterium]